MKILVVEDEHKTRAYLQKGLEEAGFTVDAVERGEEALPAVADGHHDLIILDVMLPGRRPVGDRVGDAASRCDYISACSPNERERSE